MGEKIATRSQTLSALLRDFVIREGKLLGLVDVIVFDRFRARLEASEEREREREREQGPCQQDRLDGTDD